MAMILITHDLGVVAGRTDEVAVMYAGRVVDAHRRPALFKKMRNALQRGAARGYTEDRCRSAHALAGDFGTPAGSDPTNSGLLVFAALPLCGRPVLIERNLCSLPRNRRTTSTPAFNPIQITAGVDA